METCHIRTGSTLMQGPEALFCPSLTYDMRYRLVLPEPKRSMYKFRLFSLCLQLNSFIAHFRLHFHIQIFNLCEARPESAPFHVPKMQFQLAHISLAPLFALLVVTSIQTTTPPFPTPITIPPPGECTSSLLRTA